jgi:hypothetical protein
VVIGKGMQVMIHEKRVKEKLRSRFNDARLPIMALATPAWAQLAD